MDELSPSPELLEVDPDLMRRVAWGMIAGKSKAELAEAEGLTPEECEIVCTAPGMFSIMNVWVNFLGRRNEGGRKNTRKLTGWCVDHVFQNAPERLNRNEVWRLDRLSSVMLHYGFAIVFGWMLGFLDGVMGVPGARQKVLDDFRQNLVDLLCWAVEVTFREKMLEQYSVEMLIVKDGAFQATIAGREYFELGIGGEPRTFEEVAAAHAEVPRADGSAPDAELAAVSTPEPTTEVAKADEEAATATADAAEPKRAETILCDQPFMTRRRPRSARASLSRPALDRANTADPDAERDEPPRGRLSAAGRRPSFSDRGRAWPLVGSASRRLRPVERAGLPIDPGAGQCPRRAPAMPIEWASIGPPPIYEKRSVSVRRWHPPPLASPGAEGRSAH